MLVNDFLTYKIEDLYPDEHSFAHLGDKELYKEFLNEYIGSNIRYTNPRVFEARFLRIKDDFYPQLVERLRVNHIAISTDMKAFSKTGESITNTSSNPTTMNNPALEAPLNFVENQTSSNSTKSINQTIDDKMRSIRQGLWTDFLSNFAHLFVQICVPQDQGLYKGEHQDE